MTIAPTPWEFATSPQWLSLSDPERDNDQQVPYDYDPHAYVENPQIYGADGSRVVGHDEYNVFEGPHQADHVRLILAAPELLDLAFKVLEWWETEQHRHWGLEHGEENYYEPGEVHELALAARAVIAKATGSAA